MNYEELGSLLRSEREKRGLNIEEAANALKINPRQLRALESGNVESLPHPAYVRGFIRSYATWLGISNDEIMAALDQTTGARQQPASPPAKEELVLPEPPRKSHAGSWAVILVCLLAAGGYFAWRAGAVEFLSQKFSELTAEKSQPAEPVEEKPLESNQDATASAANPEPDFYARPSVAPETQASVEPEPEVPALPENSPEPQAAPAPEQEKSEAAQATAPERHKLIITAIEECWVHSNADKTESRQFSLRKGDTFALTFGSSLELKLGNAGGVRLRYDGDDLPPPGTSGQVKTLFFPPKAS